MRLSIQFKVSQGQQIIYLTMNLTENCRITIKINFKTLTLDNLIYKLAHDFDSYRFLAFISEEKKINNKLINIKNSY